MDDKTLKGLVFVLLMVPVALRYFYKTAKRENNFNWIDYAIAAGIVVVVIAINL